MNTATDQDVTIQDDIIPYDSTAKIQREWDKLLLEGWRNDVTMLHLRIMHEMDFKEVIYARMRRYPLQNQNHLTARRFLAAHLTSISEKLWDGVSVPDILYLLYMEGNKIERSKIQHDFSKSRAERNMVSNTISQNTRTMQRSRESQILWDQHRLSSQWNKCK